MKVMLRPYDPADTEVLVPFVTAFWAIHHTRVNADEARQELADWSAGRHRLYVIEADGAAAGFLHLNRRGPVAAWVEDLFVAEPLRRRLSAQTGWRRCAWTWRRTMCLLSGCTAAWASTG